MPRGWSNGQDRLLIALYEQGIGLEEMANELGIPDEEVNQRLRELDRRPRVPRPRPGERSFYSQSGARRGPRE